MEAGELMQSWTKSIVRTFLKNFHKGDIVPVQLLPITGNNGETRLMLSKIPELEGGIDRAAERHDKGHGRRLS